MKKYSLGTLKGFTKEQLIEHIQCLQNNLEAEERLNTHMYKTVTAAMHKNEAISNAISEVLDTWNKYSGHRYVDEVEK